MRKDVMVIAEVRQNKLLPVSLELTGKARELADKLKTGVTAVVLYDEINIELETLINHGSDRVIYSRDEAFRLFNQEIHTNIISQIIKEEEPEIVLAGATSTGRTVLPAVAGQITTGLTADCTGLDIEEDTGLLLQTRPAIGGNIMATIKTPEHRPQMATVRPKTFKIPASTKRGGEIVQFKLSEDFKKTGIEPLEFRKLPGNDENIQELDVIVAGGKGLKRKESFRILERLADLLDAGVGASRPTIEAKWMEYPHQVGLSGKVVSPKLYFAIGISGAIQHIAGMETSEMIVAINKDKNAPIFEFSDFGFCGDLFDILPKLISRIEEKKNVDGDKDV